MKEIDVKAGKVTLKGNLEIPKGAKGIVLFAHGSGSGRHSPRNNYVAEVLNKAGLATLLMDLLTVEEEIIAIALGTEREGGHVRSAGRFREREGGDGIAGRDPGQ